MKKFRFFNEITIEAKSEDHAKNHFADISAFSFAPDATCEEVVTEHEPVEKKCINSVELASEIASLRMDIMYLGQAWMEQDDNDDYIIMDKYQDEFNEYYDEAHTMINGCVMISESNTKQ